LESSKHEFCQFSTLIECHHQPIELFSHGKQRNEFYSQFYVCVGPSVAVNVRWTVELSILTDCYNSVCHVYCMLFLLLQTLGHR